MKEDHLYVSPIIPIPTTTPTADRQPTVQLEQEQLNKWVWRQLLIGEEGFILSWWLFISLRSKLGPQLIPFSKINKFLLFGQCNKLLEVDLETVVEYILQGKAEYAHVFHAPIKMICCSNLAWIFARHKNLWENTMLNTYQTRVIG